MSHELEGLQAALRILREQESEALAEAADMRASGAAARDVAAKVSEAERLRARINTAVRELEERQLH